MIIDGNKYICFQLMDDNGKSQKWAVVNISGGYDLGLIKWYFGWRQYTFIPNESTEFNNSCLDTISAFLTKLNKGKRITE